MSEMRAQVFDEACLLSFARFGYPPCMLKISRDRFNANVHLGSGEVVPIRSVLGIGLNYAAHAHEQGSKLPERPVVFTKAAFCVLPSDASGEHSGGKEVEIVVPKICQDQAQVDFEGELVIVIGAGAGGAVCRDVPRERAHEFVLGYAAGNDVSARWWQKQGSGGQFVRGKSFDTFAPISNVVEAKHVPDPSALRLTTQVNGVVMQDSPTADMIFDCLTLIADLSRGMTLVPGTLVYTGTPSGVGMARTPTAFLQDGDVVTISLHQSAAAGANVIATCANRVRFE